ncbi:MAG: hypothetical protein JWM21_1826 [Acidobacteria bacterium]|nr:hypothetical protein [Acidobacteriota bacterium]
MRKQLLKGLTMLMALMALAMVSAVASANGQSLKTKASIPFEFVVGDQTLPAGAYVVSAITSSGDASRISDGASENSAVRLTMPANGTTNHAKLVFHRYGERYFLAEVWSTRDDGRQLNTSSEERAIQKELSRIASSKPAARTYERVEIALAAK